MFNEKESLILRHLTLNDPGFINNFLDIPYDTAQKACASYSRAQKEFHEMQLNGADTKISVAFESFQRSILRTLEAEAQHHD